MLFMDVKSPEVRGLSQAKTLMHALYGPKDSEEK